MLRIPGSLLIAVTQTCLLEAIALFHAHPRNISSVPLEYQVILIETTGMFLAGSWVVNLG